MDANFYLALADIRLLQTLQLLRMLTRDHPDREQISRAAEALASARDIITNLRSV
jgi:hypothetical protein